MNVHSRSSWFLAVAIAGLVAGAPAAATTTVYKCFDRSLGVLYTDQPCRGEQIDIEPGRADPVAIAELAREREALSRAVAERIADNRRLPVAVGGAGPDYAFMPPAPASDVYYPAGPGYYAPYDDRVRNRGRFGNGGHGGNGDNANRARIARSVPAIPPSGISNRTFR